MRKLVSYSQIDKLYKKLQQQYDILFYVCLNDNDETLARETAVKDTTIKVILDLYSHARA